MLKKFVLLTSLALLPGWFFAQSPQDSLQVEHQLQQALQCLGRAQVDSALTLQRQGLAWLRAHDDLARWLSAHIDFAYDWLSGTEDPFTALTYLEDALRNRPREPRSLAEWRALTRVHMHTGYFYHYEINDLPRARKFYEQAFQLFVNRLGEHDDDIADYLYHQLGNVYTRMGDYARAQQLLQRGIDYGKKYHQPQVGKYGDLAIALIDQNKNEAALAVIREGLRQKNVEAKTIITTHLSEAQALLNLHRYPEALAALNQVPTYYPHLTDAEDEIPYYAASHVAMLGALRDSVGDAGGAGAYYQQAVQLEEKAWGTPYRREVGKAHYGLGNFYLGQGRLPEALQEFQQTLRCVLPKFQPASPDDLPDSLLLIPENTLIEGLEGKARVYALTGQLERALRCYELIPSVERLLRATHAYESSSLLALEDSRARFETAIDLAWQLYAQGNYRDQAYVARAFRLTELSRGMLLLQTLTQAQATFGLPDSVRRRENLLQNQMAWYEEQIAALRTEGKDSTRLAQLANDLFQLKQSWENFQENLRQAYPDYARLTEQISLIEAGQVHRALRRDQTLLDYFLTDHAVYIFYVKEPGWWAWLFGAKPAMAWRRAELPAAFRDDVIACAGYLAGGDEMDMAGLARSQKTLSGLYQLLLPAEIEKMTSGSLVIVPDDVLALVPFEALLRRPPPEGITSWAGLSFLINDFNIGYAYSVSLLKKQRELTRSRTSRPDHPFAGFAPAYQVGGVDTISKGIRYPVEPVEGTAEEVREAHDIMGGLAFYGDSASEAQYRRVAHDCRVLLLAMHGFPDEANPELARLRFGQATRDSVNDNILYAAELQVIPLQAALVVLSACHTGAGRWHKGEGIYSLARAFAAAEVPATVMSQWRLQTGAAPKLMGAFFRHLEAGQSVDRALRQAKLEFMEKNAEMMPPFYWAGVMAIGDMEALGGPAWWRNGWMWAGLMVALAALSALVWWRKSSRGRRYV